MINNNKRNDAQTLEQTKLSTFVKEDFNYAGVFENHGLDFCCNGNRTLKEACVEKGIDSTAVINELKNTKGSTASSNDNYRDWDMSFLIDYIINNHHNYVRKNVPLINKHLQKIAEVHGENHPYLHKMRDLFAELSDELYMHMEKEEKILFPVIKELEDIDKKEGTLGELPFESVKDPINMMESEHDSAGNILKEMTMLSDNYTLPDDACTTYDITFKEIQDFEKDLHKHIHLENNILFPKAEEVEFELNNY